MSIRKISSFAGACIVALSLTGCLGSSSTHEPQETDLGWTHAKNKIGPKQEATITQDEIDAAAQDSELEDLDNPLD